MTSTTTPRTYRELLDTVTCVTCRDGCQCETKVDPMCEHFGCWGVSPTRNAPSTCPGGESQRVWFAARRAR